MDHYNKLLLLFFSMYTCFISYNVYFMIAGNMWNLYDLILQSKDNHIDVCVCDAVLSSNVRKLIVFISSFGFIFSFI